MRPFRVPTLLALGLCAAPAVADFPLKDGDVWVMAGDSITAQHLHSNYIEAFCYARYPKLTFAFRNSGVGGHTVPTTLARFRWDVAPWKPTVVSVELGMNDAGGTPTDQFVANMGTLVGEIRKAGARPVLLAPSPVNDGSTMAALADRNKRLADYSTALRAFAETEKVPYADQFHALIDVWGRNKARETIDALRPVAADDALAGVEHLRALLAAQAKGAVKPVSLQGDPVHPKAPGQLMMAAALLKDLGADGFVSAATIDAAAATGAGKGCAISAVKATATGVLFDRLDECLPFPIADDARPVLPIAPDVAALSRYTLTVTGLKDGPYALKMNGVEAVRLTAKELAAGVNLTTLPADRNDRGANAVAAQMRAILGAVAAKEVLVGQWRGLSLKAHTKGADPALMDELAARTRKVEAADAKIREAAKPVKVRFEVAARP